MPWSTKLAKPLTLKNGTNLVTFIDAIEVLVTNFAGSKLSEPIDQAIGLLVKADTTRKAHDIEAATDHLASVFQTQKLM